MKLPFTFPFGKQEKKEYFLALLLREEKVSAVIFEEFAGKIRVVGEHEKHFPSSIEHTSMEEFLEALDEAISTAEGAFSESAEIQKTIFGVKEDWVEGEKIKKEYLVRLKKASDELGLSPIGFLVIQEAIANLMQKEEGAPVSAILIEVGKHNIAVSLLRAGRVLETKRTKLEDAIPKTTDRILHHFTEYEVLPSRIVLFDDEKAEELSQTFISYTWSKSLPFLHVPQITVLPKGFDAKAVLFGAAMQMGFEVLGNIRTQALQVKEITDANQGEEEKQVETDKPSSVKETFGFVRNHDIATPHQTVAHRKTRNIKNLPEEKSPPEDELAKAELAQENQDQVLQTALPQVSSSNTNPLQKITKLIKNVVSTPLSILSFMLKAISVPKLHNVKLFFGKGKLFFIPPTVVILFIALILLYVFNIKAQVTLRFTPKPLQEEQNIVFSTNNPTDYEKHRIRATFVENEEEGTASVEASGKKEVGEKAKGTITIYNSSLSEGKTFTKGTIITSSNNLEFLIDSTISVASASGDASSIQSSNVKASITAKDIGKEYNLPSGTKFSIASLLTTTVIAKNDAAFSGGSKKEVTVASKEDVQKASEELTKNLEKKTNENIAKKIDAEDALLPNFYDVQLVKKELDKDIGEETQALTIKGTVLYRAIAYNKKELATYAQNVLTAKQNNDTFSESGIHAAIDAVKKKNDKEVQATVRIKASLIPKIDKKKLADTIAGKSFADTEIILLKTPQASDVLIELIPNIPLLPKILPKLSNNITFIVETDE